MLMFRGGLIALPYFKNYKGESTFKPMTAVAIKVGKGSIRYRIHAKGKGWYPWVTGYDKNDFHNGYAGDGKNVIDGIQIEFDDGSNKVWYRSSAVNNGNWTVGNKVLTGAMDKLQIAISRTNPF